VVHQTTPAGRETVQGIVAVFLIHRAGGIEQLHKAVDNISEKGAPH
jgi:hypothetical protein